MTLGSLGLSLAEGEAILAEIQTRMVAAQIEGQGEARRCCGRCGRRLPNKGHYRSTFRSAFGNVPVRVRRVKACSGGGQNPTAPLFTRKSSTAPELRYLNAKLAALLPFGKVADFLNEVLPETAAANPVTVRNRTRRVGASSVARASQTGRERAAHTVPDSSHWFGRGICEKQPAPFTT